MKTKTVKLGDAAFTTSGGTPSRSNQLYFGGNIPWVKSGELPDGEVFDVEERITELGLANSNAKILSTGTLLIAMYGATVGKLGILRFQAATNQAICAITPDARFDSKFLFYWLLKIRRELIEASFGGAQPNISQGVLRNLDLPLIPIDEQRAIVDKLNCFYAVLKPMQAAIATQSRDIELLPQKFLEEAFNL